MRDSEGMEQKLNKPDIQERNKSEVKNYRGVTLMDTAYKIYASI